MILCSLPRPFFRTARAKKKQRKGPSSTLRAHPNVSQGDIHFH
jgi:hypothetical protein